MTDNARRTGPAVVSETCFQHEAHFQLINWLVETVERFPKAQKFLLGDRIQKIALDVLNRAGARDDADERHICPLHLDVIERAVVLWSNPGDVVFSPFAGIGSEGYQSLRLGRKFVGAELKESYFNQACANLLHCP